jgi:hypothetical protein
VWRASAAVKNPNPAAVHATASLAPRSQALHRRKASAAKSDHGIMPAASETTGELSIDLRLRLTVSWLVPPISSFRFSPTRLAVTKLPPSLQVAKAYQLKASRPNARIPSAVTRCPNRLRSAIATAKVPQTTMPSPALALASTASAASNQNALRCRCGASGSRAKTDAKNAPVVQATKVMSTRPSCARAMVIGALSVMSEASSAAEAPTRYRPAKNTVATVIAAMTTDGSRTLTSSTPPASAASSSPQISGEPNRKPHTSSVRAKSASANDQWPTIDHARGSRRSTVERASTRRGVRRWVAQVGPAAD